MSTRIKQEAIKRIDQIEFCQFVDVGGETKTVTFTKDVLIVEQKHAHVRLSHGGVELEKIGNSSTTAYLQKDYDKTIERFKIAPESTLLVEGVVETVEYRYIQVAAPYGETEKEGYLFVDHVPNNWCIKTKNELYGTKPQASEFWYPSLDWQVTTKSEVVMSNHSVKNEGTDYA